MVINEAVAISGTVFFVSSIPNADVYGYGGISRLYAVNYKTSLPGDNPYLYNTEEGERYEILGAGIASKPVFNYDHANDTSELVIQSSDATVHTEPVNGNRPLAIYSWRSN